MRGVFILILISTSLFFGCGGKTVVTNLPPGVTSSEVNSWTTAVHNLKIISDSTHAVQVAVITSNRNGLFKDGPAYATTVQAIGEADAIELQATQFLQTVPNQFGQPVQAKLMAYTQQIVSQLNLASSQLGVPQNIVTNIIAIVNTALQIEQLIQSLTAENNCLVSDIVGVTYPCYPIPAGAH